MPFVCDPFGGANQHVGRKPFRLEHVLYLIWDQVVKVMDNVGAQNIRAEETHVAASARELVVAAVLAEDLAFDDTFVECISVSECTNQSAVLAEMALGAPVDAVAARELIATVSPGHFTPSKFLAYTWCMSKAMVAIVGTTATPVLKRQVFHDALGRAAPDEDHAASCVKLIEEVKALRREINGRAPVDDGEEGRPAKFSRTSAAVDHTTRVKHLSVELAAAANVAFRDVPKTIAQATRIAATLRSESG